jgi:hypothetical protein
MVERRERDTIWKLVEAKCAQLSDSVSSARVPFLLALTWAFIWAWALYSVDLGYLSTFRNRYYESTVLSWRVQQPPGNAAQQVATSAGASVDRQRFGAKCKHIVPSLPLEAISDEERERLCALVVKSRHDWAEKAYLDSTLVSFPGGFAKLSISDLGIVGQVGLFLILSWCFFSMRRENHAIRAIVDMDSASRENNRWFPTSFILEPKDPYFSAENVAYAYHSVAQRFVFLFSQHSRPLLIYTVMLIMAPAIVASWNMYTDLRDIIATPVEFSLVVKTFIEMVILGLVWWVTLAIVRLQIDTSVLLNGWHLASRFVWMEEWDETNTDPASRAKIDVLTQTAEVAPKRAGGRSRNRGQEGCGNRYCL